MSFYFMSYSRENCIITNKSRTRAVLAWMPDEQKTEDGLMQTRPPVSSGNPSPS